MNIFLNKCITRIIIIKTEFESFKNYATLSKTIAEKKVLTDPHMRTRPMLFSVQSQPDTHTAFGTNSQKTDLLLI